MAHKLDLKQLQSLRIALINGYEHSAQTPERKKPLTAGNITLTRRQKHRQKIKNPDRSLINTLKLLAQQQPIF
jgi:hypothetical protein